MPTRPGRPPWSCARTGHRSRRPPGPRRLRLGGDATATVDGLAAALTAAADRYTARHGRLPYADEQRAVDRVGRALARARPDLAAELGIDDPNG